MARLSQRRSLVLWANGRRVGRWVLPKSGPMELHYDPEWTSSDQARPISLSLPMNVDGVPLKGDAVASFFDNLLPDTEIIRQRIRSRFGTQTAAPFDLLEAIGKDCVGALQLVREGETPPRNDVIDVEPLKSAQIEELLRGVTAPASTIVDDDDFRISIAGAQEKTALTLHDGRWCRPRGATPSTHLFKLPLGLVGGRRMDMSASLENEWLCAHLLKAYGMPVAECTIETFGDMRALVVERFDRTLHATKKYWLRLPQEDFCQATATPSASKYESDGGPGLVDIAAILQSSEERDADLATLLRAQLIFWMLAATDGHAKNFSIRLLAGGRFRLTPLYDVLSAWPIAGSRHDQIHPRKLKLAMAVRDRNKHYKLVEIRRRHFNATARLCGLGADMERLIDDVVARTPTVIDEVARLLPRGFPQALFECITAGLRRSAATMAAMPA